MDVVMQLLMQMWQNQAYQSNMINQTLTRIGEMNQTTIADMMASNQRIGQGWINALGGRDPQTGLPNGWPWSW